MKSKQVVVKVEKTNQSDGLSGGFLEASSLAELGEESLAQAKDNGGMKKKRKKRKASYSCRFCDKVFDQGQALGGHMNCHPEARAREKLLHYEKLLKQTNSRAFKAVNPRESSSYSISNFNQPRDGYNMVTPMVPMHPTSFIQQPQLQLGPIQVRPIDPQQLSWLQVPTDGINLRGLPNDFIIRPNLSTTYAAPDATVNGNYVPHSMDPSMSSHLTSQYTVPAPSSVPCYVSYGYSTRCDYSHLPGLGTYQEPHTDMHRLHTQGHSAPCVHDNPSYLGTYQKPQRAMQTQEGKISPQLRS